MLSVIVYYYTINMFFFKHCTENCGIGRPHLASSSFNIVQFEPENCGIGRPHLFSSSFNIVQLEPGR